jgi:hypothetical protein
MEIIKMLQDVSEVIWIRVHKFVNNVNAIYSKRNVTFDLVQFPPPPAPKRNAKVEADEFINKSEVADTKSHFTIRPTTFMNNGNLP